MGGPRARIAGKAAAHLHGLEREAPTTIEVLVPLDRQVRDRWPWTFRRERPGAREPRSVGVLSRTTVEDTVLDLVDRATTAGEVQGLVASAVQQRRSTVEWLRRAAAGRARVRHRRLVDTLLDDVASEPRRPWRSPTCTRSSGFTACREAFGSTGPGTPRRSVTCPTRSSPSSSSGTAGWDTRGRGGSGDLKRDNAAAVAGELTLRYGWRVVGPIV